MLDSLTKKGQSLVFLRPEQWPISLIKTYEVEKILSIVLTEFKKILDSYNFNILIKKNL